MSIVFTAYGNHGNICLKDAISVNEGDTYYDLKQKALQAIHDRINIQIEFDEDDLRRQGVKLPWEEED